MNISGKVKRVFDAQTFDSGFSKREIVVTTKEQYPQDLKIEWLKDAVSKVDGIKEGDEVEVEANLRGSEYQGKYYVQLVGWKISVTNPGNTDASGITTQADLERSAPVVPPTQDESGDLPF